MTPIWEIPFPAVTICNMNKIQKSRVEHVKEKLEDDPDNEMLKKEHLFMEEVCGSHLDEERHEDDDGKDLELTGHQVHEFLADFSQPCDKMILRCHFAGHDRDCTKIFHAVITDEGQCCAFNLMPESLIYKKEVHMYVELECH